MGPQLARRCAVALVQRGATFSRLSRYPPCPEAPGCVHTQLLLERQGDIHTLIHDRSRTRTTRIASSTARKATPRHSDATILTHRRTNGVSISSAPCATLDSARSESARASDLAVSYLFEAKKMYRPERVALARLASMCWSLPCCAAKNLCGLDCFAV